LPREHDEGQATWRAGADALHGQFVNGDFIPAPEPEPVKLPEMAIFDPAPALQARADAAFPSSGRISGGPRHEPRPGVFHHRSLRRT
jgi:hypothetical protein